MKKLTLLIFFNCVIFTTFSQVVGKVTDAATGEALSGAHVILYQQPGSVAADQAVTGREGEFIFSGNYRNTVDVVVSYVGYKLYRSLILDASSPVRLDINLERTSIPFGEVTVSATRKEQSQRELDIPMAVVTERQIDRIGGFTAPEMLKNEPGISLARDGIWATSLNIRGLSEQRIVTLVDGNRVETATDIAAGMALIDVNDIERIEVIKGAASSLYGTGALGGVVNIITKDGHYHDGLYTEGNVTGMYQAVNRMHSENAALMMGDKRWYLRVAGTSQEAQDAMTPKGELPNSQFSDKDISLKMAVKPFKNQELKLNYQRYDARNVGIPGGTAFPELASATYPKELRDMFSASYKMNTGGNVFRDVSLKYFHQYILRDVVLKPSPSATLMPKGFHTTDGVQLQTSIIPAKGHSVIAGIDLWQRQLRTERVKDVYQPVTGYPDSMNHIIRGEIPIPESKYVSGGLYIQDEFRPFDGKLKVTVGGRYDLINVQNDRAVDPAYLIVNGHAQNPVMNQRVTFEKNNVNNSSWSANLGLLYSLTPDMDLTASLSRAFRSPSIEERYKYIDLSQKVEIGNPDLKPEDGYFADLGLRIWKNRFHLSVDGFMNVMSNLIVGVPGTTVYNYTGQPGRQDTLPAVINANVDKALLFGYDASLNFNLYDGLVLFGSSAFVRGIDRTEGSDNLPLIPPLTGRLGIRYQNDRWFGAEAACNLSAAQDRITEGETPSSGFATYDLRLYSKPFNLGFTRWSINAGAENIFDRAYINFLSTNRGFIKLEPGRNIYVKLKVEF